MKKKKRNYRKSPVTPALFIEVVARRHVNESPIAMSSVDLSSQVTSSRSMPKRLFKGSPPHVAPPAAQKISVYIAPRVNRGRNKHSKDFWNRRRVSRKNSRHRVSLSAADAAPVINAAARVCSTAPTKVSCRAPRRSLADQASVSR